MYEEFFDRNNLIKWTFDAIKKLGQNGGTNEQIYNIIVSDNKVPDDCLRIPMGGQNGNRSKFSWTYDWAKTCLKKYITKDGEPYIFHDELTKIRRVNPRYCMLSGNDLPLDKIHHYSTAENKYDWIPFYKELAEKILGFKENRIDLVKKINNIFSNTGIIFNVGGDEKGNFLNISDPKIKDIEPMTIFAYLNFMSYSSETRKKLCKNFRKEFSLVAKEPTSFDGISMFTYYQKRAFEWYGSDNYDELINLSWALFEEAYKYDGQTGNDELIHSIDEAVKADNSWSGSSVSEILSVINPDQFLSLDIKCRTYVQNHFAECDSVLSKVSGNKNGFSAKKYLEAMSFMKGFFISDANESDIDNFVDLCFAASQESNNDNKISINNENFEEIENSSESDMHGENVLYYGIPGCGKSFSLNKKYNLDSKSYQVERIVFHPDYTYSDFVGQLLPKTDDKNQIKYEFDSGPFTRILKKAITNPEIDCYLLIEEINRGNAPAIFGDIFQLLDRNESGESIFPIENKEISKEIYGFDDKKIIIPNNLSIVCTMNTADQNVFTLDTAFKRRWKMKYIQDKFTDDNKFKDMEIGETGITWQKFHDAINSQIAAGNRFITSEDKRLGVYFCSEEEIRDIDLFTDKVIRYLWDDVEKVNRTIFKEGIDSFDEIYAAKNNDAKTFFNNIFSSTIVTKLLLDD